MAVDAVRYRSRDRRAQAKAEKAKREKIILAVCVVVLLALVAFEGPKTLKKLHGKSTPPPAAAPAVAQAGPSPASTASTSTVHPAANLARIRKLTAKDPFAQQLATSTATPVSASPTAAPFVRTAHFVAKDPFVQQVTLETSAPAATAPTATAPATAARATQPMLGAGRGHYIVVLASIPLADGIGKAKEAAAAARKAGVKTVSIVNSSSYPTLRTGFYAVYSGPYPTLGTLLPALQSVRGQGYPSAYTRRLAR